MRKRKKLKKTKRKPKIRIKLSRIFTILFAVISIMLGYKLYCEIQYEKATRFTEDFWNLKVEYSEIFECDPEDIQIIKSDGKRYWVYDIHDKEKSFRIVDQEKKKVVDEQIEYSENRKSGR